MLHLIKKNLHTTANNINSLHKATKIQKKTY